jgi:splicing factor, arginine/serine-rich 12
MGRICYLKFEDSSSVASAQHLSNTVFIDRVLICTPISSGIIPEEHVALEMANNGTLANGNNSFESKLPSEVVSRIEGQMPNQVYKTYDPKLDNAGLPEYPPLPVNYDDRKIEETRRTILVLNVESSWRLDDLMDHFKRAGDVKYARFAETDNRQRIAMIEFCEQKSIISALKMQGSSYNGTHLNLYHSTQPILKPEAKSNEAAQREVEEAMNIVNTMQLNAVIDPALSYLEKNRSIPSRSLSRSRSRSRTSYSRSKRSRSRRR